MVPPLPSSQIPQPNPLDLKILSVDLNYLKLLGTLNILLLVLGRSNTKHGHHLCMPPFRICVQTQRLTSDRKCKDHRHVLKCHGHLPGPKVESVCVSGLHRSTSAVIPAAFRLGVDRVTSWMNGRRPNAWMYGVYRSSYGISETP